MRKLFRSLSSISLGSKYWILSGLTGGLVMLVFVLFFMNLSGNLSKENEVSQKLSIVQEAASKLEARLEHEFVWCETTARMFAQVHHPQLPLSVNRAQLIGLMQESIKRHDEVYGMFTIWEEDKFDAKDRFFEDADAHDATGRFAVYWERSGWGTFNLRPAVELKGDRLKNAYGKCKITKNSILLEPVQKEFGTDMVPIVTVLCPIVQSGNFYGVFGVDISTTYLERLLGKMKTGWHMSLLSHKGTIALTSVDKRLVGKDFKHLQLGGDALTLKYLQKGRIQKSLGKEVLEIGVPLALPTGNKSWFLYFSVPTEEVQKGSIQLTFDFLILFFVLTGAYLIVSYLFSWRLLQPIRQISSDLERIEKGGLGQLKPYGRSKEIRGLQAALSRISDLFSEIKIVSQGVKDGVLDRKIDLKGEQSELAQSINDMVDGLRSYYNSENKQKKEAEQRSWQTVGVAKFSDILRQDNDNLARLGENVIKHLVMYLNATIGGIFISYQENETSFLEQIGSYAYDRVRYLSKRVQFGVGLVGTCAIEKKRIVLDKVPDEYIKVSSGLGKAKPSFLVLVPLVFDGKVFGVVELASLKPLEVFEIDFIERIGENIATALASVRVNEQTIKLLDKTKKQAAEMAAQEEEMRQNLEELKATQEASAQKEAEINGQIEAINKANFLAEFALDGTITKANEQFCVLFQYDVGEVEGKHISDFFPSDEYARSFDAFWEKLKAGVIQHGVFVRRAQDGKRIHVKGTYHPMVDSYGKVYKIINIGYDITEAKNTTDSLKDRLVEISSLKQQLASCKEAKSKLAEELENIKGEQSQN